MEKLQELSRILVMKIELRFNSIEKMPFTNRLLFMRLEELPSPS
jgi:hypothetical protein